MNADRLTQPQAVVLAALMHEHAANGRVTVDFLAARVGRTKSVVHRHLTALRGRGLIVWDEGKAGTLRPQVKVGAP